MEFIIICLWNRWIFKYELKEKIIKSHLGMQEIMDMSSRNVKINGYLILELQYLIFQIVNLIK